jgi:hypothetical protein
VRLLIAIGIVVFLTCVVLVAILRTHIAHIEPFYGPRLPIIMVVRDGEVDNLAERLEILAGMGYRVRGAAGGIRGPLIVLERRGPHE